MSHGQETSGQAHPPQQAVNQRFDDGGPAAPAGAAEGGGVDSPDREVGSVTSSALSTSEGPGESKFHPATKVSGPSRNTLYHDDGQIVLYQGDTRAVLRSLPASSVDCVITSPPYWSLRDYGIEPSIWGGEPDHEHEWSGIERHAERYTGKRKWQHIGYDAQAAGVKVRDVDANAWGHPRRSDTSLCDCGAWLGQLGLEPTPELYVAHVVEVFEEVRRVLKPRGTLWLNIGDSYAGSWGAQSRGNGDSGTSTLEGSNEIARRLIATAARLGPGTGSRGIGRGVKPKDLVGIPWMVAFALRSAGWWLRQDIIWHKPNPMPESAKDRCTKAHEYLFLLSKSERYDYDASAIAESAVGREGSRNSFARETATPMPPRAHTLQHRPDREDVAYEGTRNKRSVWSIPTAPYPEAHFATFPPALVRPCVLAGAPVGGTVLDPFIGSGTTAMVARALERRAIGIDMSPEYLEMARKRVGDQLSLMRDWKPAEEAV